MSAVGTTEQTIAIAVTAAPVKALMGLPAFQATEEDVEVRQEAGDDHEGDEGVVSGEHGVAEL